MTQVNPQSIKAAQKASEQWATRDTPFIFDEWYVAGFDDGFTHNLVKRTILGCDLVFYRTRDGKVVAFDDRCIHRSYPLSLGKLENDTIICGYHGFRYNEAGDVIEVPSQSHCPKGLGVRAYKIVEQGPLVWIWMGNADDADESSIPSQPWIMASDWTTRKGYSHMHASYISLHENLLDLTHLSYIHEKSFGTPDYASAPFSTSVQEGRYAVERRVIPTRLPPIWAKPTGLENCATAARIARSEFISPALHETTTTFYDSQLPEESRPQYSVKAAHIVTPESRTSTHYFAIDGRSFGIDQDWMSDFIHKQLWVAFNEDVAALEALEKNIQSLSSELFEFSVGSDQASIAMRKYLKRRADQSCASGSAPSAARPADLGKAYAQATTPLEVEGN